MEKAMLGECIVPKGIDNFDKDGYPRVKYNKRVWRMNRLLWTWYFGEIPAKQVVAHKCNNKSCVNPNHFYITSPEENSSDAKKDGLYATGEKHYKYKKHINTLEAYSRYCDGESQLKLAAELGISQSALSGRFSRLKNKYER